MRVAVLDDYQQVASGYADCSGLDVTFFTGPGTGPGAERGAGPGAEPGLDVFDIEPRPADSPWRSTPRTLLAPHLGYVTGATYEVFFTDAVEGIRAFAAGHPVRVLPGPQT